MLPTSATRRSLPPALALVPALAAVLALAACSGGEQQTGTAAQPTAEGSATEESTAPAGPSEPSPGAASDTPTSVPAEQEPSPAGAPAGTPASPGTGPAPCALPSLGLEAAPVGGAAGSVLVVVSLTNEGGAPCTVDGHPGVSFVDAAGRTIGSPAVRAEGPPGEAVVLPPGGTATAGLRIAQAGAYERCDPQPVAGLRIHPPGSTESVVVPFATQGCAAPAIEQLEIRAFGA